MPGEACGTDLRILANLPRLSYEVEAEVLANAAFSLSLSLWEVPFAKWQAACKIDGVLE